MPKGLSDLDSLISTARSAARIGRNIGNALVPRGSARARALSAGAERIANAVTGSSKKKKNRKRKRPANAGGRAGRPRKKGKRGRRISTDLTGRVGLRLPAYAAKLSVAKIQRLGYHVEYESGGSITDPAAVYVAHGFPTRVVLEGMCCAIVRRTLMKFGLEIKGWNVGGMTGSSADRFQWTVQHQNDSVGSVINISGAVLNGQGTALQLGVNLANLFMQLVTNTQNYQNIVEIRCLWTRVTGVAPNEVTDYREEYRMMASDIDIQMYYRSILTLQNRTNSVGGGTDESSVLDVAHNPLIGKVYFGKNTHVNMKSMDGSIDNRFITINPDTGFNGVAASAAATTVGAKKLPYWQDLTNVYGSTNCDLKAGEIRDSYLVHKKVYKFANIFKLLFDFMRTADTSALGTDQVMIKFPIKVLGFEKKIDSRTAGQPDVALAWQHTYHLGFMMSMKRRHAPLRLIAGLP